MHPKETYEIANIFGSRHSPLDARTFVSCVRGFVLWSSDVFRTSPFSGINHFLSSDLRGVWGKLLSNTMWTFTLML